MVEPAYHRLSIAAQCRLLRISRSSYYYAPVPETDETLALMTVIDETFMDCPWYGSRQMARHLRRAGHEVGRRRARRHLSVPAAQGGDRAAQSRLVCRRDIHPHAARVPLPRGNHGLSEPQGARLAAVEHDGCQLLCRGAGGGAGPVRQAGNLQHGPGQQFTSRAFTSVLREAEVRLSMDGRGRWMNNVFIERLWRSLKHQRVYLHAFETRIGAAYWPWPLDHLLQHQAPALGPGRENSGRGL